MRSKATRRHCHDCDVIEGGLHEPGCDMESCPFCGEQLITCNCCYEKLDISCEPGTEVYENGLSPQDELRWAAMLQQQGRIPYILYPNMCSYCGELWPGMFSVPDDEWERHVEPRMRSSMLCHNCYDHIAAMIGCAAQAREGDDDA